MVRLKSKPIKSLKMERCHTDGKTVVTRIPYGIHRMRGDLNPSCEFLVSTAPLRKITDLINSIKDQLLLLHNQPECISPIPSVVLDYPMRINLDPQVEGNQGPSDDPSEHVSEDGLVGWEMEEG
jgi:hypothetical protein